MVQYNQYVDPETDAKISRIAEKKKVEKGLKYYSKTDVALELLQNAVKDEEI